MNKYTVSGIISWITAGCVAGFQGIKTLMNNNYTWHNITLGDLDNHYIRNLPDYIHFGSIHHGLEFLINDFPLYQMLLVAGLVFFIFDSFTRK